MQLSKKAWAVVILSLCSVCHGWHPGGFGSGGWASGAGGFRGHGNESYSRTNIYGCPRGICGRQCDHYCGGPIEISTTSETSTIWTGCLRVWTEPTLTSWAIIYVNGQAYTIRITKGRENYDNEK